MRSTCFLLLLCPATLLQAADLVMLTAENWDKYAPRGKEVDCIYGDFVLQNDQITAIVANPIAGRNANHRLREVGGALLDLTVNNDASDQLSAFHPGAGKYALRFAHATSGADTPLGTEGGHGNRVVSIRDMSVQLTCRSLPADELPSLTVTYRLAHGKPYLLVTSIFSNRWDEPVEVELADRVYAEATFEYGGDSGTNLAWWYDKWFGQAYGIVAERHRVEQGQPVRKRGSTVRYSGNDESTVRIAPGDQYELVRRIYPGRNLIEVRAVANRLAGKTNHQVTVTVKDAAAPVEAADVTFMQGDLRYAWGRTPSDGTLVCRVAAGKYTVTVESVARGRDTCRAAGSSFCFAAACRLRRGSNYRCRR